MCSDYNPPTGSDSLYPSSILPQPPCCVQRRCRNKGLIVKPPTVNQSAALPTHLPTADGGQPHRQCMAASHGEWRMADVCSPALPWFPACSSLHCAGSSLLKLCLPLTMCLLTPQQAEWGRGLTHSSVYEGYVYTGGPKHILWHCLWSIGEGHTGRSITLITALSNNITSSLFLIYFQILEEILLTVPCESIRPPWTLRLFATFQASNIKI
jgi:hypothetical protein